MFKIFLTEIVFTQKAKYSLSRQILPTIRILSFISALELAFIKTDCILSTKQLEIFIIFTLHDFIFQLRFVQSFQTYAVPLYKKVASTDLISTFCENSTS